MIISLERPLFRWVTMENSNGSDTTSPNTPEQYLVLDPVAVNTFIGIAGAKKWHILETLALLSKADPEYASRRTVRGSIPDILLACSGSDSGWSESTMKPTLRSLEDDGYIQSVMGRKRGRKGGQEKTTWILAESLCAPLSTPVISPKSAPLMPITPEHTNNQSPEGQDPQIYDPPNLGVITTGLSLTNMEPQICGPQGSRLHYEEPWMRNTSMEVMDTPMAELADETTEEFLLLAVTRELRTFGWTTDVAAAIRRYGLLRIAAFVFYTSRAEHKVKNPGAFIRTRLNESDLAWPDGWIQGTRLGVSPSGSVITDLPFSAEEDLSPPPLSTAQIMEIFTGLTRDEQERLRRSASGLLPQETTERAQAWRAYLADIFTSTGLLQDAS